MKEINVTVFNLLNLILLFIFSRVQMAFQIDYVFSFKKVLKFTFKFFFKYLRRKDIFGLR